MTPKEKLRKEIEQILDLMFDLETPKNLRRSSDAEQSIDEPVVVMEVDFEG